MHTMLRLPKIDLLIIIPGWIEEYDRAESGRAAFKAWVNHSIGEGELTKWTAMAKARLQQVHYKE
jgi:hypothetical protein